MLTSTKNGQDATLTYNNDDQLTAKGSESFTYDNKGNRITAGSKAYDYNFDNRLTQFIDASVTTDYKYDGKGNRLEKKVGNVTTEYINDVSGDLTKVLVAKNTSNNTSNFFVQGPEVVSEGGAAVNDRKYYIHDGLGNARFVTGADGSKLQELSFDPYGSPQGSNGSHEFQFKGEQTDQDGMYFMRARYYDPATGRFISRDPVEGALNIPLSQNPYAYALTNPVVHSDPSGEIAPIIVLALVSGGAGAVSGVAATAITNPNATPMDYVAAGAMGAGIGMVSGVAGVGLSAGTSSLVSAVAGNSVSAGTRSVIAGAAGNAGEGVLANAIQNSVDGDSSTNWNTGLGTSAVIGAGAGAVAAKTIPLQGRQPDTRSYLEDRPHGANMSRIYAQQYVSEFGGAIVQSAASAASACR